MLPPQSSSRRCATLRSRRLSTRRPSTSDRRPSTSARRRARLREAQGARRDLTILPEIAQVRSSESRCALRAAHQSFLVRRPSTSDPRSARRRRAPRATRPDDTPRKCSSRPLRIALRAAHQSFLVRRPSTSDRRPATLDQRVARSDPFANRRSTIACRPHHPFKKRHNG